MSARPSFNVAGGATFRTYDDGLARQAFATVAILRLVFRDLTGVEPPRRRNGKRRADGLVDLAASIDDATVTLNALPAFDA